MKKTITISRHSKQWVISLFLMASLNSFSQAWDIIYEPTPSMGRDIVLTSDFCYLATSTNSPFDPGISLKINQRGGIVWETPYGGMAVQQTLDQGYVLAGCMGYQDASITKLDENGNFLWAKQYGGMYQDELHAIIQSSDSGLVAAGFTQSYGDSSIYVIKTDASGNLLWNRAYKCLEYGISNDLLEFDMDYYIVGSAYDANYAWYLYITKLNSNGTQEWSKTIPGGSPYTSVEITPDSALIVSARNTLFKLTLDGDIIWTKSLDPTLSIQSIDIAPDNGFILSGSKVFANTHFTNALVKTDSFGNSEWVKIYRGVYDDYWGAFESVKCANENGYTACGYSLFENSTTKLRIIKTDSYGDCIVGMDEGQKQELVSFYPNPTRGSISSDAKNISRIELFSVTGSMVMSCTDCSELDLRMQPSGIYIVKTTTPTFSSFGKIIKQ
jgi:hypothetical protein